MMDRDDQKMSTAMMSDSSGIDPLHAGESDGQAAGNDGGGGKRVAEHVDEGAADVDVVADPRQHPGEDAVHDDADGGGGHHQTGLDDLRMHEAVDGSDRQPDCDADQGKRIDERGQHSSAAITKGFFIGGRAAMEIDRDKGQQQRQKVGSIVAGFGDQRQAVGAKSDQQREQDIAKGEHQRNAKDALGLIVGWRMHMHTIILPLEVRRQRRCDCDCLGNQDAIGVLQAAPAFGNDDAVGRIFRIVAHGSRTAEAGGINQRGALEKCQVLGALITNAGDVVAIHQRSQIAGVGLL